MCASSKITSVRWTFEQVRCAALALSRGVERRPKRIQLRGQGLEQLRKVPIQRFRIAALHKDFVAVAEDQRAKPVPLRFEDPCLPGR
jgi:hypothetical protein